MMKPLFCASLVATLLVGCSQNTDTESSAGENPLNAPADYLGGLNQAEKSAVRVVDQASIDKAIDLFQLQEERLPTNLNELVAKKYLPVMPEPPRGGEIKYDPKTGKVEVTK